MADQSDSSEEEFRQWIQVGIDKKWCSEVVCEIHEGLPESEEELNAWDNGTDHCIWGVRVWIPT
jgi:hypothetical protein